MSRAAPRSAGEPAKEQTPQRRSVRSRFIAVRARVRSIPGGFLLWRAVVTLLGVVVIAIGVVLLPLPGPGWLIIFAGLGVLATEYEWAATLLRRTRVLARRWSVWTAGEAAWVKVAMMALGVVFFAALVVGGWLVYHSL